jgi:predicted CopG family antitoxin
MKSGQSFGDFLRSLVGKSRKDILDSASFARLYDMNMSVYGGGGI